MTTPALIDQLSDRLAPARPLPAPGLRALAFLAGAAVFLAAIALAVGPRHDLAVKLGQSWFLAEWLGSIGTGIVAVVAAFHCGTPGRARLWSWAIVPPLAAWMSGFAYGCWSDWARLGPDGLRMGESWHCFRTITLMSIPLGLALLAMLRHAHRFCPIKTPTLAGLGVAALASANMSVFHHLPVTLMVLVWHGLAIALVVVLSRRFGGPALAAFAAAGRRIKGSGAV